MKENSSKNIFLLIVYIAFTLVCNGQNGTWTWKHGSQFACQEGIFGTQGVAAPANTPPSAYEPASWTDHDGNFWVFGGAHGNNFHPNSALWKFEPATNMWTWMNGLNIQDSPGNYGVMGIPSPTNMPRSRGWGALTWVDEDGDLWMFGGGAFDGSPQTLSDLWRYNIASNEWTWMGGPSGTDLAGNYGTYQQESSVSWPDSRSETRAAWLGNDGYLWFFGGGTGAQNLENDVWRYNINTNCWAWMSGTNIPNTYPQATYGTLTVESPQNNPGGRNVYASWKDNLGCFWIMGGMTSLPNNAFYLNDVWRYNPATNMWACMADGIDQGNYNQKCIPGTNYPIIRFENLATWTDECGNFWNYGGSSESYMNDLWVFNPSTLQFTWAAGTNLQGPPGIFGTINVPNSANYPPGLSGCASFTDTNGDFWLFGGANSGCQTNTLWKYERDTTCLTTHAALPVSIAPTASLHCLPYIVDFYSNNYDVNSQYHWDFGDAGLGDTSNLANPTYAYTSPGTYQITYSIIDTTPPCHYINATLSITVVVPQPSTYSLGADRVICPGATINLGSPQNNVSPIWNTGNTTTTIQVSEAGTYWVEITAGNCIYRDTVNVTIADIADINLGNDTAYCFTDSLLLDATIPGGPYTYLWNTGSHNATIYATTGGQYWVSSTVNQCTVRDTITITDLSPNPANLSGNTTICSGDSIELNAFYPGASYVWNTGDTTAVINVSLPGTYTVIIKDACIKSFSVTIDTVKCGTGLNTNLAGNGFSLYPNPINNDIVTLYFNQPPVKPYNIYLYTVDGRLINSFATKEKACPINLAGISNGIYLIKVDLHGQTITQKLVVAK